jgi:hypothetical protein
MGQLPGLKLSYWIQAFILCWVCLDVPASAQMPPLVIEHINVVDVSLGRIRKDQTVTILRDKISAVRTKPMHTRGATVIDGSGKFLIPGLWDMHVHLGDDDFYKNAYLPLFVANGITGIRIMEGSPAFHAWRNEIEAGHSMGPRLVIASSILDGGASFLPDAVKVNGETDARAAVDRAKQENADFIKVYDNLSAESYYAIMDEAKRLGLKVAGHVPNSITAKDASDAG